MTAMSFPLHKGDRQAELEARRDALREEILDSLDESGNERLADLAGRVREAHGADLPGGPADLNLIHYIRSTSEASHVSRSLAELLAGYVGIQR